MASCCFCSFLSPSSPDITVPHPLKPSLTTSLPITITRGRKLGDSDLNISAITLGTDDSVRRFSRTRACRNYSLVITSFLTAAALIASVATADAICEPETLSNIPQTLSGDCKKPNKIQRPKSRKAESCTVKCVNTCIRGDEGEGPLNVRRPLVVFKQGFRSRQYCLVECSDICNLIGDADDGP